MSSLGTPLPERPAAEPTGVAAPRGLLWSVATVAIVLAIVAFLLWGIGGAGTLFDMIVALCT